MCVSQSQNILTQCDQSVTGSGTKGTRKINFSAWGVHGPLGVLCACAGVPDRNFVVRGYWDE